MADDLAPIRNALTERAGNLARYLIGEPTAASGRGAASARVHPAEVPRGKALARAKALPRSFASCGRLHYQGERDPALADGQTRPIR